MLFTYNLHLSTTLKYVPNILAEIFHQRNDSRHIIITFRVFFSPVIKSYVGLYFFFTLSYFYSFYPTFFLSFLVLFYVFALLSIKSSDAGQSIGQAQIAGRRHQARRPQRNLLVLQRTPQGKSRGPRVPTVLHRLLPQDLTRG